MSDWGGLREAWQIREDNYDKAKADSVAALVLVAMRQQDLATYTADIFDRGAVALKTAAMIREALAK